MLFGRKWIKTDDDNDNGDDDDDDDDVIYQTWDAVFHQQMKHREESRKYDAQRSIFD